MPESPFQLNGEPTMIQPCDRMVFNKREGHYCIIRGSQTLDVLDPQYGKRRFMPCMTASKVGIVSIIDTYQVISSLLLFPLERGEAIETYIFQQP